MKTIRLEANKWTEISDKDCKYQVITPNNVYIYEGTEAPDNIDNIFIAVPTNMNVFVSGSNNKLYAYSPSSIARVTVG
jgi:hypothetical protein